MKYSRLILSLTVVCLLLSAIACGSKEPIIETPAGEMNLTAADLGSEWSQLQDTGLDDMPAMKQPHVQDANMRMFGADTITGLTTSIVFSTKTVASAQEEMKADSAQDFGQDIEEQLAGLALEALAPPGIGDEVVMRGGNYAELGLNVYVAVFRKANVIAMLSLVASEEFLTEEVAVGYVQELAAKIH
jgi:hypothetical protein